MGEQRTCDIRAVSEADRLQTRFRLLPSCLIKLIFMESVREDWNDVEGVLCNQKEVHALGSCAEKRESHVRHGLRWELTGDVSPEGRHTIPYISCRLMMRPVLY